MNEVVALSGQRILVTGGAGYIGSHTVLQLLKSGAQVTVLDNLCNSKASVLDRIERLAGIRPEFVQGDIRDAEAMRNLMARAFDAVIHFAGLKAVGESVANPLLYYDNNVNGSRVLLEALLKSACRRFVFSSSATVYGDPIQLPIQESHPIKPINPYGQTKAMIETMLKDIEAAYPEFKMAILRYFNPVGADASGLMGEDPNGVPNNLMPFISQVAIGRRSELTVFGSDYPTIDGTGVRDYIHVADLAGGHLAAVQALSTLNASFTVNLGTGQGTSVLELVHAFEKASGRRVPYRIADRRPGDSAACFANPDLALEIMGWKTDLNVNRMCEDTWRWQSKNPDGYPDS